jgi:preprotein translocase subunit SecG
LPFLLKVTAILAAIFFATSLALSYLASPHVRHNTGVELNPGMPVTNVPVNTENQPASSVPNR